MAGKISDLTALTGANTADGDLVEVVDVSDTTYDAAGTNKKQTIAEAAAAIGASGRLNLAAVSAPTAPSAGSKLFTYKAARSMPASLGPGGVIPVRVQPMINGGMIARPAAFGSATINYFGMTALTAHGNSAASASWASTNVRTQAKRVNWAHASTAASSSSGFRGTDTVWRGNAAGLGGFHFCCRFAFAVIPATRRWGCGLLQSGNFMQPGAEPSAHFASHGVRAFVGQDTSDTAIQFMHTGNDNAGGNATKSSSGISSPTTSEVLEVNVYTPPNGSSIWMSVQKLNSGVAPVEYEAATNIPVNTQTLSLFCYLNNSTGGGANGVDMLSVYMESEI